MSDNEDNSALTITEHLRRAMRAALEPIGPCATECSKIQLDSSTRYTAVVRAAFVKCYEFCVHVTGLELGCPSFFLAGSLRGMCEDFIYLSVLKQAAPEVAVELIECITELRFLAALRAQERHFEARRPFQPIIKTAANHDSKFSAKLSQAQRTWGALGFKVSGKKLAPTTKELAESCGLLGMYEYLFASTSDIVHFNPYVSMKSAWGGSDAAQISFWHFDDYYGSLCMVYGADFLIKYSRLFRDHLNVTDEAVPYFKRLREILADLPRWPENITWEELNREPPDYRQARFLALFLGALDEDR